MNDPTIETEGLKKRYGDVTALDDLSLSVGEGEVFGFLGPNGAGKSTTINILTGQLEPDAGSARVAGVDPVANPVLAREKVGILPENGRPPSFLTVREYFDFVAAARDLEDVEDRVARWTDRLAFESKLDTLCTDLSQGERQKVLVSQGLVFGVVAVLLIYLPGVVPVRPSPGLTLAAVLALGAFTTYNWLCQFEDAEFYGAYPIGLPAVFRSKLVAYLLLSVPSGLFYLALGTGVFGVGTVALGAAVYVPLAVYVFGVTAYVAGLSPTELLFDTPVFAAFSLAMMAALLPLVVMAIAYPLAPTAIAAAAVGLSLLAGGGGLLLYRRAGPRWTARGRRAD